MDYYLYKDLIDKSPFAYNYYKIIKNEDNSIKGFECQYINKFFEKRFGIKKDEMVGRFFNEFHFAQADIRFNVEELPFFSKNACVTFQTYKYSEKFGRWFKMDFYKCNNDFIALVIFELKNNVPFPIINEERPKEKYKDLLDKIHEGVAVIKEDRFIYVNKMMEEITGYTKEELLNMDINKFIDTIDVDLSVNDYIKSDYDIHIKPYQFKFVDKNNNIKWLEISTADIEWDNESCVLSIINDVTKRKEIEESLKKSKKRKELLIKSMNNLIFILDSEYRFLEVYTSQKDMLFIEPSKFLGKRFDEIGFPEKAMQVIMQGLEQTKKYEEITRIEYSIPGRERISWYDASITLLKSEGLNDKKEYMCVIREITDMKESEIEIRSERDLFSEGPVMTVVWDYKNNWTIKKISKNMEKILGYKTEMFLDEGFSYMDIVFPEDRKNIISQVQYCIENQIDSLERSYRLKTSKKKYYWFYDFTRIIRDSDGMISEVRGYLFDQSHIKEIEDQLQNERERLKNIIKGTNAGSWEWDFVSEKMRIDKRWAEIIGYKPEEIEPMTYEKLISIINPEDLDRNKDLIRSHIFSNVEYYEGELRMKHKNGNWIWISVHGKVLKWTFDKKPLVMFGTNIDISERKLIEERIMEASIRDPLTNVYNRRYIFDRLKEIKEKYKRKKEIFSVAIADLDYFKRINDNYGHLAGDFILQEFTRELQKNFRFFDLIGRYGGEEFIIVMMGCSKEKAAARIEKIKNKIEKSIFSYENSLINFTFSCGVADSEDLEELILDKFIDRADKRLYKAKNMGRNRVEYTDS